MLYVCLCVCVHAPMCALTHICTHRSQRSRCLPLASSLHFIFLRQDLSLKLKLAVLARAPRLYLFPHLFSSGVTDGYHLLSFYLDTGDLNSGLHDCISTLSMEPSPHALK